METVYIVEWEWDNKEFFVFNYESASNQPIVPIERERSN